MNQFTEVLKPPAANRPESPPAAALDLDRHLEPFEKILQP